MALNPSKLDSLESPIKRANDINDPSFTNAQGYYPYDLTHQELSTPLFGEVTPSMHLDTIPGDRFVVKNDSKLIRNQIDGNLLSQLNQYVDSFYVSLRTLFPTNYEKLIPNPTKGSDLPNAALPQVPFNLFVKDYLTSSEAIDIIRSGDEYLLTNNNDAMAFTTYDDNSRHLENDYALSRMLLLSTILSRGQLLDYLGVQFDLSYANASIVSEFQTKIDTFQRLLFRDLSQFNDLSTGGLIVLGEYDIDLNIARIRLSNEISRFYTIHDLSEYRSAIADIFERGKIISFGSVVYSDELFNAYSDLYNNLLVLFDYDGTDYIETINTSSNPFQVGHLSLTRPLAYQLCVAQYFTNDAVDNVYNSDLYLQLLRSVMFPVEEDSIYSSEPTFLYNGVTTEYDYISAGAFYSALISDYHPGHVNRQFVYATLMFLKRRSLRYGDYFSTARPRMLAVGDLAINVTDGMVSPIDVTRNLLQQRYLNAVNYIGSSFMPYMQSIFGVIPSDIGSKPRFIAHRKIALQNQITNNTSDEQGKQTTNLVGYSSEQAFDVFIDDFGVLLDVISFDVLPVYTSGIDAGYHLSDRFDYFNPMLQNIGDQPIYLSELCGDPKLRSSIFGYTMRNAELKFKNSRAHGAFSTFELSGYLMKYPIAALAFGEMTEAGPKTITISPEFIRDKPMYIDRLLQQQTGISPCEYWHFIVATTNEVHSARKVQMTPPVLF